jgi:hypothetical protein
LALFGISFFLFFIFMFVVRRHGRRPPALTSRRANPLLKMAPPALRAIEKLNRKRETCPAAARPTAIIIT